MHNQLAAFLNTHMTLSGEELDTILSNYKPIALKKNELLLRQGQTSQRSYFVGKGCLRMYFINEQGQEATRFFSFENQLATALMSFITGEPSEEWMQAIEPTEALYITHKDFYHLLFLIPQWETFYRGYLERAYVNNTKQLMSFLTLDATEKYRRLLNENPVIVRRLPNKMVASYLNISQETLSRLKSKI